MNLNPKGAAGLSIFCSVDIRLMSGDVITMKQSVIDYLGLSMSVSVYLRLSQAISDYVRLSQAILGNL